MSDDALIQNFKKAIIFIDSSNRDNGTVCDFTINLTSIPYKEISQLSVSQVVIPYAWNDIETPYNKIFFKELDADNKEAGISYAEITPGNYSAQALANAIETELKLHSSNNLDYGVSYNPRTGKFIFSNDSQDIVKSTYTIAYTYLDAYTWNNIVYENYMSTICGFNQSHLPTKTITSDRIINLLRYEYINIHIDQVITYDDYDITNRAGNITHIAERIPIPSGWGSLLQYSGQTIHNLRNGTLDNLRLSLRDTDGTLIDLDDNHNWTLTLSIYYR